MTAVTFVTIVKTFKHMQTDSFFLTLQDGSTLIHLASKCGHPEVALFFVKRGVPLQMPNKVCTSKRDLVFYHDIVLSIPILMHGKNE